MLSLRVALLTCLLATAGLARQKDQELARQKDQELAQQKDQELAQAWQKLAAAPEEKRSTALMNYIRAQIESGAVYAGQYANLRKLEWETSDLLGVWLVKAPEGVSGKEAYRNACLQAVRDIFDEEVPEELLEILQRIATDDLEEDDIRSNSAYALAQFGRRELVDGMVEKAEEYTRGTSARQRAGGWQMLADIHYNLRSYKDAAKAFSEMIALIESGEVRLAGGMSTLYYNSACATALAGLQDDAFILLEKSLEVGLRDGEMLARRLLETDMDMASLRKDERFAALLKKYFPKKGGG